LLFEPKWDRWRATCFIKEGEARFVSRKHNSLNERFPQLNHVNEVIKATTAVLDGEIVRARQRWFTSIRGVALEAWRAQSR
jgi:ATP-dependent DNA ligase